MKTSVIIVAYQPHEWLTPCLTSVVDQADEIVVVDNGSPGSTVADAVRAAGARLVRLPRNTGFPAGVNAGIDASSGDVIALLNDDAMAEPGWLASAVTRLDDVSVAAVAPKLVFAQRFAEFAFDDETWFAGLDPRPLGRALRTATTDGVDVLSRLTGAGIHDVEQGELDGIAGPWRWTAGPAPIYVPVDADNERPALIVNGEAVPVRRTVRLINNAGSYLSTEGYGGDYGYLAPDDGAFDQPADRFAGCGAGLVATAETLRRVGPWAGSFFAYYEDLDWCWRARLMGLRFVYEPSGVVRHVGGVTSGGPAARSVRRLADRNRLLCLTRNAPWPVVRAELRKALTGEALPADLRRSVTARLPAALGARARTAPSWKRTPTEVWDRWAGTDNSW